MYVNNMRIFTSQFKKTGLIIFVALFLCIAFFYLLMFRGVLNSYITENFSHIISVENIDPNLQNEQTQNKSLVLNDETSAGFFADCPDISHIVYIQDSDSGATLYLDNGEIICHFPEMIILKDNNSLYKTGSLLSIGQNWKSLGPKNYFDQPTRRHVSDYVYKVDILNKTLDVVFESKAKERVLYADFEIIITYFDGVISYYNFSSGEVIKTTEASFMQKNQKYTIKCLGDNLTVSTKSGQLEEIKIK